MNSVSDGFAVSPADSFWESSPLSQQPDTPQIKIQSLKLYQGASVRPKFSASGLFQNNAYLLAHAPLKLSRDSVTRSLIRPLIQQLWDEPTSGKTPLVHIEGVVLRHLFLGETKIPWTRKWREDLLGHLMSEWVTRRERQKMDFDEVKQKMLRTAINEHLPLSWLRIRTEVELLESQDKKFLTNVRSRLESHHEKLINRLRKERTNRMITPKFGPKTAALRFFRIGVT